MSYSVQCGETVTLYLTDIGALLQQLPIVGKPCELITECSRFLQLCRMKMYDFYSMEMQSKFICVLPTSL